MAAGDYESEKSMPKSYTMIYDYDPLDPVENYSEYEHFIFYAANIVCPIAIFGGVFSNILAFVVLVRGRLWLKHEGYVYLAANFCANIGILSFRTSSIWITSSKEWIHYYPPNTSTFMCKMWPFLVSIFLASGWLCVALLFNVYLREHLIRRRRCGCPMFAAKYCTLFASKIIVGIIFSVLLVLDVPYMKIYEINHSGVCFPSSHVAFVVSELIKWIVMWALPFFLFLPIILLITLCTKRGDNTFGFSQIEERSAADEQMRVVAVTLSSMLLFSQLALMLCRLVLAVVSQLMAPLVAELVYYLSIASQPILCFVILKELSEVFRSLLRNIRCCRRLFPSLDQEEEAIQLREEAIQLRAIQEDPPNTTVS